MLLGACYMTIAFWLQNMQRSGSLPADQVSDDYLVRVAVQYGSSVAVTYKTAADSGYYFGWNDGDNVFHEVGTTESTSLQVVLPKNLAQTDGLYAEADEENAAVGCYNIKIVPAEGKAEETKTLLSEKYPSVYTFTGVIGGAECLLLGTFTSKEKAGSFLEELVKDFTPKEEETSGTSEPVTSETSGETSAESSGEIPAETSGAVETSTAVTEPAEPQPEPVDKEIAQSMLGASVLEPTDSMLTAVDGNTDKAVFLFDDASGLTFLSLRAIQPSKDSTTWICGYVGGTTKRLYDGTLEFCNVQNEESRGVRVVDVLPLDIYICGVIPYEIGNSWPIETQKAFAVAVRSFVVSNKGRHKSSYNADVCNTGNCQVFKGFGSANSMTFRAANETKGMIAVCNGKICNCMYSSSMGYSTANCNEIYGSSVKTYPYLTTVATPWEKETHTNASWSKEYTQAELRARITDAGYSIGKKITKIETVLGQGTSYVYQISFTDSAGKTVTVKQGNKVKSLMGTRSGNFVIGLAGSTVERTYYTLLGFGGEVEGTTPGVSIKTNPYDYELKGSPSLSVITKNGIFDFPYGNEEKVITASGKIDFSLANALDSQYYPKIKGVNGKDLPSIQELDPIKVTETIQLDGTSGSFVIVGRGWGHGLGLSQYGACDLGNLGYDYQSIFKAYYRGAEIVNIKDFLK